eukprot:7992057-Lingulodinium_polyedra.AAC.1
MRALKVAGGAPGAASVRVDSGSRVGEGSGNFVAGGGDADGGRQCCVAVWQGDDGPGGVATESSGGAE